MKDILIWLWVLIIPLTTIVWPFLNKMYQRQSLLPQKQKLTFSNEQKIKIGEICFRVFAVLFMLPMFLIGKFREEHLPVSSSDILSFLLIAEILAFDFMTIVFYFQQERNMVLKILAFLFSFINLWTSTVWIMNGKLTGIYFFFSMICYPLIGLNHIISYYIKKGRTNA